MTVLMSKTSFFRKTVGGITVPTWRTKVLVWVMPVLFLAAGLLWLAASFFWILSAEETIGKVTQVYKWEADNAIEAGETLYGPVFSYVWTDGNETTASLGMSSPDFNFEIGSTHTILFDPNQRGNVRFPGFRFNYLGATVILAIGTMFTLVSLVLWAWVKAIARKRDLKGVNP